MKLLLTICLFLPGFSLAQQSKIPSELNWLIGTWHHISSDSSVKGSETWTISNKYWTGIAKSIRNGDTVVTETLRLKINNRNLKYIADVIGNKNPVSFNLTSYSDSGFICENLHHDFPKKIEYKLDGQYLKVIISGDKRKKEFNFIKHN